MTERYCVKFGNRGRTGARELGGNGADPEPSFYVDADNESEARERAEATYLAVCLGDPTDSRPAWEIKREFERDNAIIDARVVHLTPYNQPHG